MPWSRESSKKVKPSLNMATTGESISSFLKGMSKFSRTTRILIQTILILARKYNPQKS